MRKKSSWMNRLGAYRIRLKKNKFSKPSRSRSLRWACNRWWGWWWRGHHSICLKDADKTDLRLSADFWRHFAGIKIFHLLVPRVYDFGNSWHHSARCREWFKSCQTLTWADRKIVGAKRLPWLVGNSVGMSAKRQHWITWKIVGYEAPTVTSLKYLRPHWIICVSS